MKLAGLETLVRALNQGEVRYLIVGGVAVNSHGYGRNTYDIDLVIQLEKNNIEKGFAALASAGWYPSIPVGSNEFADKETRESWIRDKGMIVLKMWSDLHAETPVDIFVREPFDFDSEYALALWQELAENLRVPILRIETLLQMKREAARPKDLADLDELNLLYGNPSSYDRPGPN